MKINETLEMAYPQKLARDIIIGITDPINENLIKLIAFQFDPQLRDHFRAELRIWLNKIQRIRLKPNARTGSIKFYFDPSFDYPIGGVETHNTRVDGIHLQRIRRHTTDYFCRGHGQPVEGLPYQACACAAQRGSCSRDGAGMIRARALAVLNRPVRAYFDRATAKHRLDR